MIGGTQVYNLGTKKKYSLKALRAWDTGYLINSTKEHEALGLLMKWEDF